MSTFNKHLIVCLFCGKGKVMRASQRCDNCKNKKTEKNTQSEILIGHRDPAVILDVEGTKVFVDKNGREIVDHGYDLENDHHGWKKNGYKKPKTDFI